MFTQPEAATSEVRSRTRIVVAALLSLFLVVAGALTAPPARALVDGAVITGTVSEASETGLTVQVQAGGLGQITGAYAALIPKGAEAGVSASAGYAAFAVPFPAISEGATSFTLSASKDSLDRSVTYEVLIWQIHSGANASTIYARSDVAISSAQWDAVFPPAPAAATTTTLSVDPASSSPVGATFTLGATVAPAASGTVAYSVNGNPVGSAAVGQTVTTSVATAGTAQLSAVFTPADPAAFLGSTSASVAYEITTVAEPEPEPEPEPTFDPAISVFRADGTTPFTGTVEPGETLVVKGTGFDPAANVGGRGLPIPATLPQGTYVVFGHFAENWKPSAGAASANRKVVSQKWALAESVLNQVPAQYQATVRGQWVDIAADGSFTAPLVASETTTPVAGGAYGVYTYGAGGVSNADQELSVPVAFAPDFDPAISVFRADGTTPVTGTVDAGETLVVKGTGFDPAANVGGRGLPIPATLPQGTYVVFGQFAENWKPSAGAASANRKVGSQKWALAESVLNQVPTQYQATIRGQWVDLTADGSFTATLTATVPATLLDGGRFGVYTYGAGGVTNADQELYAPIAMTPEYDPAISVFRADGTTPLTGTVVAGETLVVKGTGFDPASNVGGRGAPIPATLPQGTYVVFGQFAENWKPSAGAASANRKVGSQKWALAESVLNQVPTQYQATIRGQWAALSTDGSFSTTLTVTETAAVDTGRYGVYTYGAGGVTNADQELYVPVALAPVGSDPALEITVTGVNATTGATVDVTGTDLGTATGAYAAIIEKGTEANLDMDAGYVAFAIPFPVITDGSTEITFVAPTAKLDKTKAYEVLVWKQHSAPDATTIYARADVPFTEAHWKVLFPNTIPPVTPPKPVEPQTPAASGSLRWAISSSFTDYVAGSIAKGSVAVSGGATRAGGLFQFGQAAGSTFDATAGTGSVSYIGAVRFTGHGGILDVTIANPQIRATSTTSAALYVTSGGSPVHFADLNLGAATRTTADGAVTFAGAPATLTAAGRSQVFQGYATSLDPITFTVGSVGLAPSGSTGTVAAASTPARTVVPATPPTAEGIVLDDETLAALSAGEPVEISASGFQPNEEGILVVVYSTPIVLDDVTADATGTATWSGTLPATLADGEHTLTFQGSVDRGIRFTLARAAKVLDGCVVEGASLNWGFKETFRTYIEGIATGGWELSDVVYEYPEFVWSQGTGAVDIDARTGLISYGGSLRFTGHSGALDTTLSDARLELAGDTGYIVFDITGTTQDGEPVSAEGVRFAEFALPDLELTDEGLVLDALPATLTAAGAAAFGTYPAGEELDAVSALIPVDTTCGAPVAVAEDAPVAEAEVEQVEAVQAQDSAPLWPWAVGGLALVLVIGAASWVVVARRRAAHAGADTTGGV